MYSLSQDLIDRICQRDKQAFEEFYTCSVDHFFRYVYHTYALPHDVIDDVLADVYIKIRNNLERVYDTKWFIYRAWSICKNTLIDYFKKKKEYAFSDITRIYEDGSSPSFDVEDADIDTLWDIDTRFTYDMIRDAMYDLPEVYKEVLFLRYEENLQYDEIEVIVWSSSAVLRKRASRWLALLKSILVL